MKVSVTSPQRSQIMPYEQTIGSTAVKRRR